jgi:DNA invertase Pin-like site-specific DNA recombinase
MKNKDSPRPPTLVPAAQYVRMSDEQQQYSIVNQKAAIQEYAGTHGFSIVKTYADPGKSGVAAKSRTALRELLKDVTTGNAKYKAILVYDVSRWGRFPNNDESAYYEFLCFNSGIPLHYCAEPFSNDGTATSSLLKALKRSMAAEFSRELSEKVIRGKTRLVQLGFWVGGPPGYGYRRMMISGSGKPKQIMKPGEQKSMRADRVILIPGPRPEVECVRLIFFMAIQGNGCMAIARELNRRGILRYGKPWLATNVFKLVTNPKYAGCNVWNRSSQRLQTKRVRNVAQQWITKPGAFKPIVSEETFEQSQLRRTKKIDYWWSDGEILQSVRSLLKREGRLSETLIRKAHARDALGMPSTTTIHAHFGPYRKLYELVNYRMGTEDISKGDQSARSLKLRRKLVNKITEMFPKHVTVTHLPRRTRSLLLVDNSVMVSILFCRKKSKHGILIWALEPNPAEREYITLICTMNNRHDRVIDYFLLPDTLPFRKTNFNDGRLQRARRLSALADFYSAVRTLWAERSGTFQVQRTTFP